jgi:hypothetical protein
VENIRTLNEKQTEKGNEGKKNKNEKNGSATRVERKTQVFKMESVILYNLRWI